MVSEFSERIEPVYFTDALTLTSGEEQFEPTFTSAKPTVFRAKVANILCKATGAIGSASPVYFHFVHRGNEKEPWPTVASLIIAVTVNGIVEVIGPGETVNTMGMYDIKLLKVINGNASTVTGVRASISYKT